VLKRYPRLSETFIVQEILEMERRGIHLVVFAIMDPHEALRNPAAGAVRAPVYYLQRSLWRDAPLMLLDHLYLALKSPSQYRDAVRHLTHSSGSRASFRAFLQAGRLARLSRQLGIAHLHAHFAHNPTSLARYASQMIGVSFSFTAHAKDLYLTRPESLINKAELASFITTCTHYNSCYLNEILPTPLAYKVHTVYHGVDTTRFHPPAARERRRVPVLLSIGRLVPKKGYEYLLDAAHVLIEQDIAFRLDIYGTGPLKDHLQQLIDTTGLRPVAKLCGARVQSELIDAYGNADVFVLAPIVTPDGDRDGIPNVLLEAMASGLPVVSTDISGIPELVHDGVNGYLVPAGDSDALAAALRKLLASPTARERVGRAARETVCREFDAGDNAERMASLLQGRGIH
jgi:glycosyltransferase involved in cell wall biosynthesis